MQPVVLVVAPDPRERKEWASLLGLYGFAVQEADNLDVGAGMASVERVDAILLAASCGLPPCPPSATLRCVRDVIRALAQHCQASPRVGTVAPVVFAQPTTEPASVEVAPVAPASHRAA